MKYSYTLSVGLAGLAQLASAHYFFDVLVVDGVASKSYEYVRANSRDKKYMPTKYINTFDNLTPDDTDFRCNLGATSNGNTVGTAEVAAGSELAMVLGVGATMQHPGPAQVYLSKAPGSVADYDGSGDWFKIHQETTCTDGDLTSTAWCTWDKDRVTFTIPADTPDGEYLVRSEHIGLHGAHNGEAEFFYSCAQIKVTGGGSGTPGPVVSIPGVYKQDDAAINFSIYGTKDYTLTPGPAVWGGGSNSSSSSGSTGGSQSSSSSASASPTTSATPKVSAVPTSTASVAPTKPTGFPGAGKGSKASCKSAKFRKM
ncbi:hypothetical protein JX265_012606 [Neoarthrinium moseri]|uniref:lytic cellulose monooxygenase (C4-dehydrogenating) n=1 Tax=Neoarthrinium moseri TaxID=1658444 RepID=A0A9Q0AJL3_9PEZI|nr:hypothetical protein JX266_011226 [Neoarthrinium moseri]KAI1853921.1 hypothetical protein JX265_012606 [Neoarthrinium moseri]